MFIWLPVCFGRLNGFTYTKKFMKMANKEKSRNHSKPILEIDKVKVKFEVYGDEMVEKVVKQSGNSGRIYLPPEWVGSRVKIIRIE